MFFAAGPAAIRFCDWVNRLGEAARELEATWAVPVGEGVQMLHLEAVAARLPATTTRGHVQQ